MMFGKRKSEKKTYDKENLRPVLKCSICNGEQVAGFKNIHTGRFEEVLFIREPKDIQSFMDMYGLDELAKEY